MSMTISQKIAAGKPIALRLYRPKLVNGRWKSKLVRGAVPDEVALGNQPPGPIIEPTTNGRERP